MSSFPSYPSLFPSLSQYVPSHSFSLSSPSRYFLNPFLSVFIPSHHTTSLPLSLLAHYLSFSLTFTWFLLHLPLTFSFSIPSHRSNSSPLSSSSHFPLPFTFFHSSFPLISPIPLPSHLHLLSHSLSTLSSPTFSRLKVEFIVRKGV